jgi:hypothetical protein
MQTHLRSFLRNIELWLSFAELVVILIVPAMLAPDGALVSWKIAAVTAIGVGLLHGAIF